MATVEYKTTLGTTIKLNEWANIVTLSREEYERLLHRLVASSATPTTSSYPDAFVVSHGESWMLDSGATTPLIGNRSHFFTLSTSQKSLPVRLADGSYSPISSSGTIQPTNHLTLTDVLFAPKFPVNLISVKPPTRPLQVYSHRNRSTTTTLTALPSLPPTAAPGNPSATSANDLPIALRKGKSTYCEALRHPAWKMAMDYDMSVLISREAWNLWQYLLMLMLLLVDGSSPSNFGQMGPLNVNLNWLMYQMGIKNAFLYGDLNETVYMEQPPGYVAQGEKQHMVCKLKNVIYDLKQSSRAWFDKFSRIIGEFGFLWCQADHSIFVQTTRSGMVVLAVYFDDILITGVDDLSELKRAKHTYQSTSSLKIWGDQGFLGNEIAHSKYGVSLSQRKYFCDILQEEGYSTLNRLKNLLKELGFMCDDLVPMHCDNQATIPIASNPIFHERTKHIEVDCHFVHEVVMSQKICTPFTPFSEQRADIFTKALGFK
ncbi:UNVERIFIED_CONTAM: Retrovirus-related Pol polyprotein from transposon TNT 1-94 [Sesamum calycinum]|uniref:Retrovirus-related Pol polyprotein from transposon TNT 1-94 n=1 Tax=Sesamum calycinum TaxID=2727403 RepID=A0AAW2M1H5_9LAMI